MADLHRTGLSAQDRRDIMQGLLTVAPGDAERRVSVGRRGSSRLPGRGGDVTKVEPSPKPSGWRSAWWKGGHHAFHVLLVAMNTRLDQASELLDAGAYDAAAPLLDELAGLYQAATALMRYASTPGPRTTTLVRPSMMPPFASPGFSGLANQDHAVMLDRMASVAFGGLPGRGDLAAGQDRGGRG